VLKQHNKNMKTKMKRQRQTELPRFIVGALATAGASAANGATVQISFTNNVVTPTSAANFTPDLTGDQTNDVRRILPFGTLGLGLRTSVSNAARAYAVNFGGNAFFVEVRGAGTYQVTPPGVATKSGLAAIRFNDLNINGGVVTNGWLDMTATASSSLVQLQIHRLIFDNASTTAPTGVSSASTGIPEWNAVPEPSSLALLALGAGGLLARRRRAA
jgi:hypothetical protein